MTIKKAKIDDFESLQNTDIQFSSYKNLGYPLGCSKSELEAALELGDLKLISADGTLAGFARVKSIAAENCYFDFYVIDKKSIGNLLKELKEYVSSKFDADRFYVQLFPFEKRELASLLRAGFIIEATMKRQVFIKGRHHDLLILRSAD